MKFKSDFVTNSSSSSFIAWGISLDEIKFPDEIVLKIFKSHLEDQKESLRTCDERWRAGYEGTILEMESLETDEDKMEYVNDELRFEDKIHILMKGEEMPFEWEDSEYCEAIGISPSTIIRKYPETKFGEVAEFVAKKFNDILGVELDASDIRFFEESWYNG